MHEDFEIFRRYAEKILGMSALRTSADQAETKLFDLSLESARVQFSWTKNTVNQLGEPFRLLLGYADTRHPNAVADRDGPMHFVTMNVPLFTAINEFAMFCFTQKDFFPDVGEATSETSPSPLDDRVPGIWLLDYTKNGGRVSEEHSRELIARDPFRFEISQYLALLMVRFVWLHELSHCFNGHVAFVRKHGLSLRLHEIEEPITALEFSKQPVSELSADAATVFKCLELDADASAFWASFNIQSGTFENIEGIMNLDRTLRLQLMFFGVYAMVWLFEQFQTYLKSQNGITHPAPSLRLLHLLKTAQQRMLLKSEDIDLAHKTALNQFAVLAEKIPGMYQGANLLNQNAPNPKKEALAELEERLDTLKEELCTFEFSANR